MNWSNIKKWAKDMGYSCLREKNADINAINEYDYYWGKIDDPNTSGLATSVSKLATQIFNHMTNDEYSEYQRQHKESLSKKDIDHNGLSTQW
jgi:hypothetical protein